MTTTPSTKRGSNRTPPQQAHRAYRTCPIKRATEAFKALYGVTPTAAQRGALAYFTLAPSRD